jgi:hypothetical protein
MSRNDDKFARRPASVWSNEGCPIGRPIRASVGGSVRRLSRGRPRHRRTGDRVPAHLRTASYATQERRLRGLAQLHRRWACRRERAGVSLGPSLAARGLERGARLGGLPSTHPRTDGRGPSRVDPLALDSGRRARHATAHREVGRGRGARRVERAYGGRNGRRLLRPGSEHRRCAPAGTRGGRPSRRRISYQLVGRAAPQAAGRRFPTLAESTDVTRLRTARQKIPPKVPTAPTKQAAGAQLREDGARETPTMADTAHCSVCHKETASFWTCVVCEKAGIRIIACSDRCKRVHGRDGRHRKELKAQRA